MSAAGGWDLHIPRDASELDELWAAARRHGVEPGGRLRVVGAEGLDAEDRPAPAPRLSEEPQRRLRFAGAITDGPSDLSANTDRYLAEGFGTR